MGLIFCKVIRIQTFVHERLRIMLGYQQKAGGPPAFIKIASWNSVSDHILREVEVKAILQMISPDAVAWIVKYKGAVESSFLFFVVPKMGRKANILSSKPTHIINHWFDEIEIIIPKAMIEMRRA